MDGFRERMANRAEHSGMDRGADRYDRTARRTASYSQPEGLKLDEIKEVMDASNAKQMEIIADYFDDEKADRHSSENEVLRAIDDMIRKMKDNGTSPRVVEVPVQTAAVSAPADPAMKQDIIREIKSNSGLITSLRQELIATFEAQNAKEEKFNEQREAREQADREARLRKDQLEREAREAREKAEREARDARDQEERTERANRDRALTESLEALISSAGNQYSADQLAELKKTIEEIYKNLEDHVHKENVKCYRNVLAALNEQGESSAVKTKGSFGFVKVFSILTFVLSLLNLALLAVHALGLI